MATTGRHPSGLAAGGMRMLMLSPLCGLFALNKTISNIFKSQQKDIGMVNILRKKDDASMLSIDKQIFLMQQERNANTKKIELCTTATSETFSDKAWGALKELLNAPSLNDLDRSGSDRELHWALQKTCVLQIKNRLEESNSKLTSDINKLCSARQQIEELGKI